VTLPSREGEVTVRAALAEDVGAIAAIYGHAVRHTVATFDLTEPDAGYWLARLARRSPGDHVLVAEDGSGVIVGYAYSGAFRPRPAYARTRETSVYLHPEHTGQGIGTRLYAELLGSLGADGVHLVVAVVALPNPASTALHRAMGFTEVGTLDEVGHKLGRYVSTTWWQRRLDRTS
jgi:L-amino acid N-acyltransferase YncA